MCLGGANRQTPTFIWSYAIGKTQPYPWVIQRHPSMKLTRSRQGGNARSPGAAFHAISAEQGVVPGLNGDAGLPLQCLRVSGIHHKVDRSKLRLVS